MSALFGRAHTRLIGSDPGLLRLQMAVRTTAGLGTAVLILGLLTRAAGQPFSVALLGVVIVMNSSMVAASEPDPRARKITMALLPVPASLAVTAGAVLASNRVAADGAFVLIIFAAVYVRRFGGRGTTLGLVAFMTYFFALFLRATPAEVPWLIGAVVIGAAWSFVMSTYVLPDRPERVVRRTVQSLRAQTGTVVDTVGEALRVGRFDQRRRRRLAGRTARLDGTTVMVQTQLEDKLDSATLWPGVAGREIAMRVFDAGLAVDRLAGAGGRAAVAADMPAATRAELVEALRALSTGIRVRRSDGLRQAATLAEALVDRRPGSMAADIRRLALAIIAVATTASALRALVVRAESGHAEAGASGAPLRRAAGTPENTPEPHHNGLRPTSRQAIQVAVAASLAIVVGELVSPARWYWAVIATFVTFSGTTSWGETLTKGWQRLLGTVLGVPAGVLIATAVGGDTAVSLVLIVVCLFCGFYFMKVAYSLMIFWITTLLALLYGLLGEFSVELLLLRIEETAIGAVIGVLAAVLVLPTHTRASIRNDARAFWTTLSDLIEACAKSLSGDLLGDEATTSPTAAARQLDRKLEQFRITAKPLTVGLAGIAGRRGIRRGVRVLVACDYYARTLAQCSERCDRANDAATLPGVITSAAERTRHSIDVLVDILDSGPRGTVLRATDLLDTADALARHRDGDLPSGDRDHSGRLRAALRSLRQIDATVVDTAIDLGASPAEPPSG